MPKGRAGIVCDRVAIARIASILSHPPFGDVIMALELYYHPLASYCWKALLALYENDTPFEPRLIDLANEASRAEFLKVWPPGKFPVLRDGAKIVPESTIII